MAEKKNVTFIRKNGRIIPIRSKGGVKKPKKLPSRRNKKSKSSGRASFFVGGFFASSLLGGVGNNLVTLAHLKVSTRGLNAKRAETIRDITEIAGVKNYSRVSGYVNKRINSNLNRRSILMKLYKQRAARSGVIAAVGVGAIGLALNKSSKRK